MRLVRKLKSLREDGKGNVLAFAAASMPLLMGSAAMAVDTVQLSLWKRQLQRTADHASLAGVYALVQDKSITDAVTRDKTFNDDVPITSTTVENAPTAGAGAGNDNAVRVILTAQRSTPFLRFFTGNATTIRVESTAAVVENGQYCVVSLERGNATGISFQGSATLNMGCGFITNSRSAVAMDANGSSSITATPIAAVGGLPASSNFHTEDFFPYAPAEEDPYADLPTPAPENCSNRLNIQPHEGTLQAPVQIPNPTGVTCYRGMDIKGTVAFAPGVYFIDGSSLSFGSQAVATGTGVTFILTSNNIVSQPGSVASLDINGGAQINLKAPTSGTYSGVLIYQDRRAEAGGANTINGNANSTLQGAVYLPNQDLNFAGTSGMNLNCVQLVARRFTFTGNSQLTNTCPINSGTRTFDANSIKIIG